MSTELLKVRQLLPRGLRQGGRIFWQDRSLIDFTSWDIFGFGEDPRFLEGTAKAIEQYGVNSGASRTSTGTLEAHLSCERRFAQFYAGERGLLFSSRNQLVLTLLTSICDSSTLLICDERSESPIVDAAALLGCQVVFIDQSRPDEAAAELEKLAPFRPRVLFIEGVQGVTGNVCNYRKFLAISSRLGIRVCVDETLSYGVVGLRGAGASDEVIPLPPNVLRYVALERHGALPGAVLVCDAFTFDQIVQRSKNLSSEISPPPFFAVRARDGLDILELGGDRRQKILSSSQRLLSGISRTGWRLPSLGGSSLVCIELDSSEEAEELALALMEQGVLIDRHSVFRANKENSILRFIVRVAHGNSELDKAIEAVWEARRRIFSV